MSRRILVAGGALAAWLSLAGPAAAYYGNGASIISADLGRLEQGDDTTFAVDIATGGRYAAFQTRSRNFFADDDPDPPGQYRTGGVFVRDLDSGAPLRLAAAGDVRDERTNELRQRGAANPSLSGDGRYVAFSTGARLSGADTNGNVDVYVRDMSVPATNPGAYDLVSAPSGGGSSVYEPRPQSTPGRDPGSELTRTTAISDDGRYVVFRTLAASNLPGGGLPVVPAGQLLLRDRVARTTTLLTRRQGTGEPAGGTFGAGISADGSTVVWTGTNAAAQTAFLPGETDADFPYYLWRRVADGPSAPTRRVTGAVDIDDPGCAPGSAVTLSQTAQGPCYGPLTGPENSLGADISGYVPALSGDGRRVSFLTGSGPRPNTQTPEGLDLWTTDMSPGVSRKAGSTELTREATQSDPPIDSVAASADGRFLAIVSQRNRFVFPALSAIGDFRSVPDQRELFVVDLANRTLERAVRSVSGGDTFSGVDIQSALSSDGGRVAFTSESGDLFFGDANARADAFWVARQPEPAPEAPPPPESSGVADRETVSAPARSAPRLSVRTRALSGGVLEVRTLAPAAGGVKLSVRARVPAGRRTRSVVLVTASARARKRSTVQLRIRPVRRYRGLLARRGALAATLTAQYVPAQGTRRLSRSVRVTFREKVASKKSERTSKRPARPRKGTSR